MGHKKGTRFDIEPNPKHPRPSDLQGHPPYPRSKGAHATGLKGKKRKKAGGG